MTVIRQRIDVPVPRKSASSSAHEKGLERFYSMLYTTFLRHIPYANPTLRAIVIASPGWVRDAVTDFIFKEATRTSNKNLLAARNKFIKVHITSPHVHSLVEVLKSPQVCPKISSSMKEPDARFSKDCRPIKRDKIRSGRHHA
jgi:protein pelota